MQKTLIILAVLFISACASIPTIKSVAGTYEGKKDGVTHRVVFLENGVYQAYHNGKKAGKAKWEVSKDGELHLEENVGILVLRINKDGSITVFAKISKDGKREYAPKEYQTTYKKIK